MKIKEFECFGYHVEIHFNAPWQRFFWVTGTSARRFSGACEYFDTVDLCESDARWNLKLMSLEAASH